MRDRDLLKVSKPSRYIGGELHSRRKDGPHLKFALVFPDVYEVGMSHLGLQILYHQLNRRADVACERAFAPWPDMEDLLRRSSTPLTSLESGRPLKEFDAIGFSLLYELNYTGVLNALQLSGIPLRAADRGPKDPFIIGGGPCALNPEPLADFFDVFVLGDGEEVAGELCEVLLACRGEAREKTVAELAKVEGVYAPSHFQPEYEPDGRLRAIVPRFKPSVSRRIMSALHRSDFPTHPVLPFMEIIHDRLNVEIARGCTRGCRFCQAGMIYRPLRERSAADILFLVEEGLKATGHDEVSLLSLSAGDHSCIGPLIALLSVRFGAEKIAVSLPSLRIETLTPDLIRSIRDVRKTGFTLAPEAGTDRLRAVINKGNTEEDLLKTVREVFSAGWRLVKLYFMIGLPTEREEDLEGIVDLCRKALREARRAKGSGQINVSVSTFIPKAHTPFQWEPMAAPEEIRRKQLFIRRRLDRDGLRVKWNDLHLSVLEGVFARGDRRLARALEEAHRIGCRLDGWSDHFRPELWEEAFARTGLQPSFYTERRRALEEVLPWDHLDSRIEKSFLKGELARAMEGTATADCRTGSCGGCGACAEGGAPIIATGDAPPPPVRPRNLPPAAAARFRSQFFKFGPAKFLGHLELCQTMARAFRRARIPLLYSQGFHPLPKISFGPPLPVGYESWAEHLDFQAARGLDPAEATARLNGALPPGLKIGSTAEISLKQPSIFDSIIQVFYKIRVLSPCPLSAEKASEFQGRREFPVHWARKNRSLDLKSALESISLAADGAVELIMRPRAEGSVRPEEALDFIFGWNEGDRPALRVQKLRVQLREDPCPTKS